MATAMGCSHIVAPVVFAGAFSSAKSRFLSLTTSLSLGVCNGSRVSMFAEWMPSQPRHAYLDGSAPGEFGFDPLRLGVIPENLERYKESELIHCRWAMLAVIVIAGVNDIPRPVELGDDKHQVNARTSCAQYEIIEAKVCHCLWRIFDSHATRLVEFEYFNGNDRQRGRMTAYF